MTPSNNTKVNTPNSDTKNPRSIIKKEDGVLAYWFSAQVAYLIVRAFSKLPVKPNHYTFLSLILGLATAVLFATGEYMYLIIGIIVLHLSFILDCCDGQVSRLKGLQSKKGHWFDYHSDKIKDGFILLGAAYGVFQASGVSMYWIFIVAFIAIFFQFLRNIAALNRDNFKLEHEGKKDKMHSPLEGKKQSQFLTTVKHSVLFKLSDRVLLFTVFGLMNRLKEAIIIYAVLELFYSLSSASLNYKYFQEFDNKNK